MSSQSLETASDASIRPRASRRSATAGRTNVTTSSRHPGSGWKRIPPNEPREYLFASLGTITRHLALDTCRRRNSQKRQALFCELTDELASCLPGNEQVESGLEAEALQEAVNRFLAGCSREKVRIFVRRYWYFDGIPAIAKACGCSESKVKVTLFRMRKNLRKQLEKEGYDL